MQNAKQITSGYDMNHDGSLSLWNYAHQPREAKSVPRTQLSIMRGRLETVSASHAPNYVAKHPEHTKTYDADKLSFHASPMFKNEEAIENVVNVLLVLTILFVIAWVSVSIVANNNELASRHSMIDMSAAEPASTGFAPMAAANFLPDVGGNIDLDQVITGASMHSPVPPPSLEEIEAMEADDGVIANSAANGWANNHNVDQMDI